MAMFYPLFDIYETLLDNLIPKKTDRAATFKTFRETIDQRV